MKKFYEFTCAVFMGAMSIWAIIVGLDALADSSFMQRLREKRKAKRYSSVEDEDED